MNLIPRLRRIFSRNGSTDLQRQAEAQDASTTRIPRKAPKILNSRPSPWGQIIHPAPGELYEVTEELIVGCVIEERFSTHGGSVSLSVGERVRVWKGLFSNPFDPLPKNVPCDHVETDRNRTASLRKSVGLEPDRTNYRFDIEIEAFVKSRLQHIPEAD